MANNGTLQPDDTNHAAKFTGTLSGNGEPIKSGNGTLILSGPGNSFGATEVDAGTLILNASGGIAGGSSLTIGGGAFIFDPMASARPLTSNQASASPAGAAAAVPEPGTLALLSVAGIVAAAAAWRRRRIGRVS